MSSCLALRSALSRAFGLSSFSTSRVSTASTVAATTSLLQSSTRPRQNQRPGHGASPFSTTSAPAKKKDKVLTDKRITIIRYHLHHPTTLMPRPLRFSRNRALRHWTIHRAWTLYRMKVKKQRELELERQYNAMAAANEELRLGAGDGGKLFRRSQMKIGTWSIPERGGGIPIEYARAQAEWVGTVAGGVGGPAKVWNHEWKRMQQAVV